VKKKPASQGMTAQMISDENQRAEQAQEDRDREQSVEAAVHERDNAKSAAEEQKKQQFLEDRETVVEDYQSSEHLPLLSEKGGTAGRHLKEKSMPEPWIERKDSQGRVVNTKEDWGQPMRSRAILDELLNRKRGRFDLSAKEIMAIKRENPDRNWYAVAAEADRRKKEGGK
tara:strand:- start:2198 stop:2710 length:513 start_codon:yes stop_codon:yes gene_type:complete